MPAPSELCEAMYAQLAELRPHVAVLNNAQPLRAQLEREVAELKAEREGLQQTNSQLLRQQASYRQRLEQLQADTDTAARELEKAKAQAQQELEAVTHKRDEAIAERNRIRASMKSMLEQQ